MTEITTTTIRSINKLFLLALLIPHIAFCESDFLDNKGLVCKQVVECKNDFPKNELYINAFKALLASGRCDEGYALTKGMDKSVYTPTYMPPIRLWCGADACSQPFMDGNAIKDNQLYYEMNASKILVHRYTLDRESMIMSQSFMNMPFFYRCEVTSNKDDIYAPLTNEINKAQ